jgi:flagellar FliL protein
MSKNAKPAAEKPAEVAAAPAAKSKKKLITIAVMVAAIAGGAGWYFTRGGNDTPHAEEAKAKKVIPQLPPKFVALEPFTVNLQRETSDQYLQVGITLKIFDAELEERIKTSLPEIRSKILLLLATKKASELSSAEGKARLIKEIIKISNAVLGIVSEPEQAAASAAPEKLAAASEASAAGAEAGHEATAAAPADTAQTEEREGIVDVLFTSFIIQ